DWIDDAVAGQHGCIVGANVRTDQVRDEKGPSEEEGNSQRLSGEQEVSVPPPFGIAQPLTGACQTVGTDASRLRVFSSLFHQLLLGLHGRLALWCECGCPAVKPARSWIAHPANASRVSGAFACMSSSGLMNASIVFTLSPARSLQRDGSDALRREAARATLVPLIRRLNRSCVAGCRVELVDDSAAGARRECRRDGERRPLA